MKLTLLTILFVSIYAFADVTQIITTGYGVNKAKSVACGDAESQGKIAAQTQCSGQIISAQCTHNYNDRDSSCVANCLSYCQSPTYP